jgi:hypothetical protein
MQSTTPSSAATPYQSPAATRQLKRKKNETDATANAFMLLFKALPAAAKSRIVELIEEYEDELDAQELAAARAANPEDFNPDNAVTLQQYLSQRRARTPKPGKADTLAA